MRPAFELLAVVVLIPACSVGGDGSTSTSASVEFSTVPPATTAPVGVDVEIAGGEVTGPDSFFAARDERLDIWILSDVGGRLHIHGYDLFYDLEPGVPLNVAFAADISGIFEVELEDSHVHLFDIEVSG